MVSKVPDSAIIRVVNQTRDRVLAERCEVARTFWARGLGLMGRAELQPGQGLLILPCSSIHTFFMRFPIDVLFLDRHNGVVGVQQAMPPNRPFAGARRARAVVELPAGVIVLTETEIGDQVTLTPAPHM